MIRSRPGCARVSVRMVRPTGPRVSSVSIGSAASSPSARSLATTPCEMTQTASSTRTKARPKLSETVSIVVRGRVDLLGEGGAAVGGMELRAVVAAAGAGLSLTANVGPARAALEVGERIVEIDETTVLVRGATILAERTLRTTRGRELLLIGTLRAYDIGALVARVS